MYTLPSCSTACSGDAWVNGMDEKVGFDRGGPRVSAELEHRWSRQVPLESAWGMG